MEKLSADIQRVYGTVTHELGETFSLKTLIREISFWRGKLLRVEQAVMPVNITGYCIALQDLDLIRTRAGLDTLLTEAACLHECAHILLSHLPRFSAGPETPTYEAFCKNSQGIQMFYRSHTTVYDDPRENDAEVLATLLMLCVERERRSIPNVAREMYH